MLCQKCDSVRAEQFLANKQKQAASSGSSSGAAGPASSASKSKATLKDLKEETKAPCNQKKKNKKKCVCNVTDHEKFMIRCDWCLVWYHGECIGVKDGDYKRGEKFKCMECKHDDNKDCCTEDQDGEVDESKTKKSLQAMSGAVLKLNTEIEVLKKELLAVKRDKSKMEEEHQDELTTLRQKIQELEKESAKTQETMEIHNTEMKEKEKELEQERNKQLQSQEETKKLKLEIGKLKGVIKSKDEENKRTIEEMTMLQREIGVLKTEARMQEERQCE